MISILNYGAGNIQSVCNALTKIGAQYKVVTTPQAVARAEKLIFPGMGAAGSAMRMLRNNKLDVALKTFTKPLLGICIGQQLLIESSEENSTSCLKLIEGTAKRLPRYLRVPQIGWNSVKLECKSKLTKNIPNDSLFYFANSYAIETSKDFIIGKSSYGREFAAIIQKENLYGVQFHPEKSGDVGLQLLRNFCELC